jgi:hypothetical protein
MMLLLLTCDDDYDDDDDVGDNINNLWYIYNYKL